MKAHKLIALIISCLSVFPLRADTPFENEVPLNYVRALLNSGGATGVKIYSDIMADFPGFELPAGYNVLGSADLGHSQSVMLRTNLPRDESELAMTTAFENEGYAGLILPIIPGRNTGFVYIDQSMARPILFCRNDIQQLSMQYFDKEAYNVVVLSRSPYSGQQRCSEIATQQELMQGRVIRTVGVQRLMPRLEVPQDPSIRNAGAGSGMSSSNAEATARYSLTIDWSIEPLHQHFADQLQNEGWQLDSEALGEVSANSVWLKTSEEGMALWGNLIVIGSDDSDYQLRFTVRQLGERSSGQRQLLNRSN